MKFFILFFCKICTYTLICTARRENPIFYIPAYSGSYLVKFKETDHYTYMWFH
jgi:hypothetical protein